VPSRDIVRTAQSSGTCGRARSPLLRRFVMKTILALIGGGERDLIIFETALAAAAPCSSHVNFLHIHVNASEAARGTPAEFAVGPAVRDAIEDLDNRAKTYTR